MLKKLRQMLADANARDVGLERVRVERGPLAFGVQGNPETHQHAEVRMISGQHIDVVRRNRFRAVLA